MCYYIPEPHLRSTILYASETYCNLKESEIRILERIEECFLRKLFKTTKACPISKLYLEAGHQPARFEIMKRRLLFLKNILNEKEESLVSLINLWAFNMKTQEKGTGSPVACKI